MTIDAILQDLKLVLSKTSTPSELNDHAWTESLFVKQWRDENPELAAQPRGYQLLAALGELFSRFVPESPPRRGKRIDPRWSQFGLLAAMYFAPITFGIKKADSLPAALKRIDNAIALYVYSKPITELQEGELEPYRLVSNEFADIPPSTLSGWHNKGLEKFAQFVLAREQYLSQELLEPSRMLGDPNSDSEYKTPLLNSQIVSGFQNFKDYYHQHRRRIWIGLLSLVILFLGWKIIRVGLLTRAVLEEVNQFQSLADGELDFESLRSIGPLLENTKDDFRALRYHIKPVIWVGNLFSWVPVYGQDAEDAGEMLDFAAGIITAAERLYQGGLPLLEAKQSEEIDISTNLIMQTLVDNQDYFLAAQEALDAAMAAYAKIDIANLSPKTGPLLEKIEPYLPILRDGIPVAVAAPRLLGAEEYGPQTYIVLLQNEDELRATGGFISAVGTLTIEGGDVIASKVVDSYALDDYSKLYPAPPWQMFEYMYIPLWVLRDANWSPDFPTTALWIEHLYSYSSGHVVDGVIAIDQQAIGFFLKGTGPIPLEGFDEPLTADNVIEFMRSARDSHHCTEIEAETRTECKEFLGTMADALLALLRDQSSLNWVEIAKQMLQALDERHILLQVDDPAVTTLLAKQGWDGALSPGEDDFLMVVESNVGYNKVNAVIETEFSYRVDLSQLDALQASLTVTHHNPNLKDSYGASCTPGLRWGDYYPTYQEFTEMCYWDYLRVYTLDQTELTSAEPLAIPGELLMRGQDVPARVDILDNNGTIDEIMNGARAWGTLIVVPVDETRQVNFDFALPVAVLSKESRRETWTYNLHIQKQPGTRGVPASISVQLPPGAEIIEVFPTGEFLDSLWETNLALTTDQDISLTFHLP